MEQNTKSEDNRPRIIVIGGGSNTLGRQIAAKLALAGLGEVISTFSVDSDAVTAANAVHPMAVVRPLSGNLGIDFYLPDGKQKAQWKRETKGRPQQKQTKNKPGK